APFVADVGENVGDLLIFQDAKRGHIEFKGLFFDVNRAVQTTDDNSDKAFRGARDPFGAGQRWRQSFLTQAVLLVAGKAGRFVNRFAGIETLLIFGGERSLFHDDLFWGVSGRGRGG